MMRQMPRLDVTGRAGARHQLNADAGGTLMEALRDADMGIEAICGGQCACATCHCWVAADWFAQLPDVSDDERELLSSLDHYDPLRSRLTCQLEITDVPDGLPLIVAPEE